MATTSFTTRIDEELKAQLDRIARFEDRSASYMANQAIRAFVEERLATRDLVETGLAMVDRTAPSIAPKDVHDWLTSDDDRAFPKT